MLFLSALSALSALGFSNADFASRCYPLGRAHIDPIVSFGKKSSHEHTFIGSDAISAWTRSGGELERRATCSSCGHGDTSSYWFPTLFWNGVRAEVADAAVYWSNSLPGTNDFQDIVLFPLGLRMIEGSPFATSDAAAAPHYYWYCFGALDKGYRTFPPRTCPENKMRLSLTFPSCWNRKDKYLPSGAHMAHPHRNGDCPAGFVRTWSLRLEVDYRLDPSWSWNGPATKFVLGTMSSAYATHADFFNGMPISTQMQMMHMCGRLGGDYCNVRPDRYDCVGGYLNDRVPVPAWYHHT